MASLLLTMAARIRTRMHFLATSASKVVRSWGGIRLGMIYLKRSVTHLWCSREETRGTPPPSPKKTISHATQTRSVHTTTQNPIDRRLWLWKAPRTMNCEMLTFKTTTWWFLLSSLKTKWIFKFCRKNRCSRSRSRNMRPSTRTGSSQMRRLIITRNRASLLALLRKEYNSKIIKRLKNRLAIEANRKLTKFIHRRRRFSRHNKRWYNLIWVRDLLRGRPSSPRAPNHSSMSRLLRYNQTNLCQRMSKDNDSLASRGARAQ